MCECSLDGCTDTVGLTIDEYETVRRHPTRFVVVPGHVTREFERVVDAASDRYEVVDKIERGAEVASDMDPRAGQKAAGRFVA